MLPLSTLVNLGVDQVLGASLLDLVLISSLQERCCCGGLTVPGQVGMVSAVAAVGRVLCLLPGSVGHLSNQPQEIRTMGRWVGSHVFILLPVCVLPLSV